MANDDSDSTPALPDVPKGMRVHLSSHAKALSAVAFASVLGIAASFLFQVLSARYLSPADFGLLAAFFVIVNVAAIGSSSLQNLVAVQTAALLAREPQERPSGRRWPMDAIVLGLIGCAAVALLSPLLAASLDTSVAVVLAAAVSIPLSFIFADAVGLMQGSGNVAGAVWWSTQSQLVRLGLMLVAMAVGAGLGGVIGAVVAAIVTTVIGALWSARRIPRPVEGAFSVPGLTIVVLTVAFAWLTSSDVFLLRAGAPEAVAGTYASVTVLVKAGFLLPATLSLYLLPRFVRNRDNRSLIRLGVFATLGVSIATGALMVAFFALFGEWVIATLYGSAYQDGAALLVPVSLAYVPWIAAQGLLIRVTSFASRAGALVLVLAVAAQWIAFTSVIPDIHAMLWSFGIIGMIVLFAFLVIDRLQWRPSTVKRRTDR